MFIYMLSEDKKICISLKNKKDKFLFFENFEINSFFEIKNILLSYINKHNIKTKKIILIIKSDEIINKFQKIENIPLNKIDKIINYNINDFFPIDQNNYIFDYKVISKTKILFSAFPKNIIEDYLKIFEELKLKCYVIDFFENVLSNLFLNIKEKTFVVHLINSKYIFLYLENGELNQIREISFSNKIDLIKEINRKFLFFSNELSEIKNIIFLDELKELENIFDFKEVNFIYGLKKIIGYENNEAIFYGTRDLKGYLK